MSSESKLPCHEYVNLPRVGSRWIVRPGGGNDCAYYTVGDGYCPHCGDRLNPDGTATRMVPAQPAEAVRETLLYKLLRDMAGVNSMALAEKAGGWELAGLGLAAGDVVEDAPPRMGWDGEYIDALVHAEFSITPEGRAILAALDAAPDSEAKPDADTPPLLDAMHALLTAYNASDPQTYHTIGHALFGTLDVIHEAMTTVEVLEAHGIPVPPELDAAAEAEAVAQPAADAAALRRALEWLADRLGSIMLVQQCEPDECPAHSYCAQHDVELHNCSEALLAAALAAASAPDAQAPTGGRRCN